VSFLQLRIAPEVQRRLRGRQQLKPTFLNFDGIFNIPRIQVLPVLLPLAMVDNMAPDTIIKGQPISGVCIPRREYQS
jgi:hypothetical protein